jgi:hypothetical protein
VIVKEKVETQTATLPNFGRKAKTFAASLSKFPNTNRFLPFQYLIIADI